MKRRHRLHAALGAAAALAAGAALALASAPTPQPDSHQATHHPVSADYATTSAQLAQLRAELTGSAQDTALLQSVVVRLQRQVELAQSRLERLTLFRNDEATPTTAPTEPASAPTKTAAPIRTAVPTKARYSATVPPPTPTPSDDDGSSDD